MMGRIPSEMSTSVEKYGIEYIRPYHREIARRLVLGQKQCDIAEFLSMSESRLSIIANSPVFKEEISRLEKMREDGVADVARTLQEISPVALEVVERIMYNGGTERIRLDAAESVLDRAGHGRTVKTDLRVRGNIAYHAMTEEEIKRLLAQRVERIRESISERDRTIAEYDASDVEHPEVCPDNGHEVHAPQSDPLEVLKS